jgi:hypothetical protein
VSAVPSPSLAAVATAVPTSTPAASVEATPQAAAQEPDWREFIPADQADHLRTMDRAARESGCGVPWQLLAAISRVESDFGRNMATSSAGAIGYGQFLPASWQAFGRDGNAYDYRDALPAISRYLCQSGLSRDPRAALFAYNHADWYVDLVLDLAVRYDRLAPGAPTPQVLDIRPDAPGAEELRYADGRDLRLQTARRVLDHTTWLGVPWHGRTPGTPIELAAMETTALEMLRTAFSTEDAPTALPGDDATTPLEWLAARAWQAGLLAWPTTSPSGWSLAELRRRVEAGTPVVLLVSGAALPGHAGTEVADDQPLLVIGDTRAGVIVSDPSFSSSLGYGLEIADVDLLKAWQAANPPLQAMAFSRAPQRAEAHLAAVGDQMVISRIVVTPPPAHPTQMTLVDNTSRLAVRILAPPPVAQDDWSWAIVAAAMGCLGLAVLLRLTRGGRWFVRGAAGRRRSGP